MACYAILLRKAIEGEYLMRGHILDYSVSTNTGTISGSDGSRYYFTGPEWKAAGVPGRAQNVDFDVDGNQARSVYMAVGSPAASTEKNKVTAGILALLLGGLGIHKFYLGFSGPGLVFLLVNTVGLLVTWSLLFLPNVILGIIAFVEGIIYLTKSDEEFEQLYVVQKKRWF
jgi:TM2 domain-containing membrane protein YozV